MLALNRTLITFTTIRSKGIIQGQFSKDEPVGIPNFDHQSASNSNISRPNLLKRFYRIKEVLLKYWRAHFQVTFRPLLGHLPSNDLFRISLDDFFRSDQNLARTYPKLTWNCGRSPRIQINQRLSSSFVHVKCQKMPIWHSQMIPKR